MIFFKFKFQTFKCPTNFKLFSFNFDTKQDDAYWWQARKETERTARAGLIPSRALQERRIIHERTAKESTGDSKSKFKKKTSNN